MKTHLPKYTETVTASLRKCVDDIIFTKTIFVRANKKPWLTGVVHRLLRTAQANLSSGIRKAKKRYSRRIANHFSDSRDTRRLWRGLQTIRDYKPMPQSCDNSTPLLNQLNDFFARFEANNNSPAQKTPPPPSNQVLTMSPDSVRRPFRRTNARKALGPDNIPGRVLRDFAEELTESSQTSLTPP